MKSGHGMQNDKWGYRNSKTIWLSEVYFRAFILSSFVHERYPWQSLDWRMVLSSLRCCWSHAVAVRYCSPCRWWWYGGWYYYSNVFHYTSLKDALLFCFKSKSDCLLCCWSADGQTSAKMTHIYNSSKFHQHIFIFYGQSYWIGSQNKSKLENSVQLQIAKWSASSASKLWQVKLARIVRINRGKTPPRPQETWGFNYFDRIFNAKIILSSSLASSHVRIPFIIILERNE